MVKVLTFIKRKSGMPVDEFQTYWRTEHPKVVTRLPGIRRYVQTHTLEHPVNDALQGSRGGPEAYDGVAELWWDDAEALAAATTTPAGRAAGLALLEDEQRFIDLARSPLFVAVERPIVS